MEINKEEAAKLRDELHNLDYRNTNDRNVYYDKLYYIIASGEGFSASVYRDSKGKLTIGYGFNMDRGNSSRNEWDQIFKGSISFDDAKNGIIKITKPQAQMLKSYGVSKREDEVRNIYKPYWDKMRLNERAIITDMYYQLPALIDKKTRIFGYLKKYYETNNVAYFDLAEKEIKLYSSYSKKPSDKPGLQNRNNIRAIIFDSRNSPLYSKPHDELIPEDKMIDVVPGETFISREVSKKFPESNNHRDYYIWRTRMDDKVRSSHRDLEGKVFKHEDDMTHPGDDHGCRCYRQRLPINSKIIEDELEDIEEGNDSSVII